MYLSIFITCQLFTLKSSGAQMSITEHCFSSLSHIMMSGRLYFTLFTIVTGWFHHISVLKCDLQLEKSSLLLRFLYIRYFSYKFSCNIVMSGGKV